MWSGTAKSKFMKAMLVPDYNYILGTDKTIKFNKKTHKLALGSKKDYDGWNFGFQCFESISEINNPYGANW